MKNYILLFLVTLFLPALAQKKDKKSDNAIAPASEYHISAIARNYGDSIVVRFAPEEPVFWKASIRTGGFTVKRKRIENNKTIETKEFLIKPWSLEEWKSRCSLSDSTAAVCAQLMYGNTRKFHANKPALGDLMNQANDQATVLGFALTIADISPFHANGLGLRFVDKNIAKNTRYLYSVELLNQPTLPHQPGLTVIETNEIYTMPLLPEISSKGLDRNVEMTWKKGGAATQFSAYWIEKSEDGGRSYRRLNRYPWIPDAQVDALYTDSIKQNYTPYQYRFIGITPFGDLSLPSPIITILGKDLTPPSSVGYFKAEHLADRQVKFTWENKNMESDLNGYILGLGPTAEGPFAPVSLSLIDKNLRTITTEVPELTEMNYFVLSAIDTSGNAGRSIPAYLQIKDNNPPSPPKGMVAKIDSLGIVQLQWAPNEESDLMGYMVYFANAKDHEFIPLTRDFLAEPFFTDSITLKTLSKEIFYRLRAYDRHQNPSELSEIFTAKKPDIIAPMPGVFETYFVSDSSVNFKWQNSVSEDAVTQIIFRKESNGPYKELTKLPISQREYDDKTVKQGMDYTYAIVTVDDSGLKSPLSFPLKISVYKSGYQPAITGVMAKQAIDKKSVLVTWSKPTTQPKKIIIYRQTKNEPLSFYDKIDGNILEFKDTSIGNANETYTYSIKGIFAQGEESIMSTKVVVMIK
jgi:uncharacterized protein